MSDWPPEKSEDDYDAEAFLGVLTMLVYEYPDLPLSKVWAMIDWPAIRLHGEGSLEYHGRIDRLSLSRGERGA